MGTTSITTNTPESRFEEIKLKDEMTTSVTLGMRITSLILKDTKGEVSEKIRKPKHSVTAENFGEFLVKILKSNESATVNNAALDFFLIRADEMLEYFVNHNSRQLAGSSVLLMVDNVNN